MHKPPAKAAALPAPRSVLACVGAGWLLGRLVLGLSLNHHRSSAGLLVALLCLAGGTLAMALLLKHRHARQHAGSGEVPAPPVGAWLMALGAGVLAGIHFDGLFRP